MTFARPRLPCPSESAGRITHRSAKIVPVFRSLKDRRNRQLHREVQERARHPPNPVVRQAPFLDRIDEKDYPIEPLPHIDFFMMRSCNVFFPLCQIPFPKLSSMQTHLCSQSSSPRSSLACSLASAADREGFYFRRFSATVAKLFLFTSSVTTAAAFSQVSLIALSTASFWYSSITVHTALTPF